MKTAIIGSRDLNYTDITRYVPKDTTLLILGGTRGIDTLAEIYADKNDIPKLIFKPDYIRYGKSAPIIRNKKIVDEADLIIAIWNRLSRGTRNTIDYAKSIDKKVKLFLIDVTGIELMPGI